jgi:hypothetical protein
MISPACFEWMMGVRQLEEGSKKAVWVVWVRRNMTSFLTICHEQSPVVPLIALSLKSNHNIAIMMCVRVVNCEFHTAMFKSDVITNAV